MREFWTNPKRVATCTVPLSSLCCLWLNWTQAVGISGTDIEWRDSGVRSSKQLWNPYWATAQPEGPAKWKEWKRGGKRRTWYPVLLDVCLWRFGWVHGLQTPVQLGTSVWVSQTWRLHLRHLALLLWEQSYIWTCLPEPAPCRWLVRNSETHRASEEGSTKVG